MAWRIFPDLNVNNFIINIVYWNQRQFLWNTEWYKKKIFIIFYNQNQLVPSLQIVIQYYNCIQKINLYGEFKGILGFLFLFYQVVFIWNIFSTFENYQIPFLKLGETQWTLNKVESTGWCHCWPRHSITACRSILSVSFHFTITRDGAEGWCSDELSVLDSYHSDSVMLCICHLSFNRLHHFTISLIRPSALGAVMYALWKTQRNEV